MEWLPAAFISFGPQDFVASLLLNFANNPLFKVDCRTFLSNLWGPDWANKHNGNPRLNDKIPTLRSLITNKKSAAKILQFFHAKVLPRIPKLTTALLSAEKGN